MKKHRILYLLLLSFTFISFIQWDSFASDNLTDINEIIYTDTNGIPTGEANTILQASDGYLWIGGYGGLLRYDGHTFENYSQTSGLTSSSIRALCEDDDGVLWVASNDQGIFYYDCNLFTSISSTKDSDYLSTRCFCSTLDGKLYAGTTNGLIEIVDKKIKPIKIDKLKIPKILSLSYDNDKNLWGLTESGELFVLHDNKLIAYYDVTAFSDDILYSVLAANNGKIYLGTSSNKLLVLKHTKLDSWKKSAFDVVTHKTDSLTTMNYLYESTNHYIWICSDSGCGYLDEKDDFFNLDYLKNALSIAGMSEDYEGNIWLASNKTGAIELVKGKYKHLTNSADTTNCIVNAVWCTDRYYYVGTGKGLLMYDSNWNKVENNLTKKLKDVTIKHITGDSKNHVLFSTYYAYGVVNYSENDDKITCISKDEGIEAIKIRQVIVLKNGNYAVASTNGIDIVKNNKVIKSYSKKNGLGTTILCMVELEDGTIIAGSDGNGIYEIKDDIVKNYNKELGLSGGVILRVRYYDGKLWISSGYDLYCGTLEDMKKVGNFNKGSGSIFDLKIIDDEIWVLKNSSIIRASLDDVLSYKSTIDCQEYGRNTGLSGTLVANSSSYLLDNKFYICTVNGVSILDFDSMYLNGQSPKSSISSVSVDGIKYIKPDRLTLSSDIQKISFNISALTFGLSTGKVSYYLEGFEDDNNIVPTNALSSIDYTNLPGGNYKFHVTVYNADGVASDEIVLPVTKKHSFFELWVSWVLLFFLIAASASGIVKYFMGLKMKKMRLRQLEYKSITDQALKTIAHTIDAKDKYTNGHSLRVALYSKEIAKRLGLTDEDQEHIYFIALLHDIGKIGVPDDILKKPGKLTKEEFEVIKTHPKIGGAILEDFTAIDGIAQGAKYHHERYDGKGYNEGLKGNDIPFYARIIGVADAYDAMSSARCYRPSMSKEAILKELENGSGTQFDPNMSQIAVDMLNEDFHITL